MKIATYNIWNSSEGLPERNQQIVDEINTVGADIVCLQEVKNRTFHNDIVAACKYRHSFFCSHEGEEEGLSILSSYPLNIRNNAECLLIVTFKYGENLILVTNCHLAWDSAIRREKQIIGIIDAISRETADYSFLVGDFNCSENSSVQNYLLGQQSLMNREANPYWFDVAVSYAGLLDTIPEKTLDFKKNPRWRGKNTIETNQRFDRILIKNPYPKGFPLLTGCKVFGKDVSLISGYSASDHYGVCIEISFL